ncbi:DEAD/DEAH box helicase [Duganella sp. LX20W]|uniref:DEAD/DEAH box helicase n=1 Tax=Rugamonas brunnea TaxID=2758569 RepID=A0A7W2ERQ6_9BURK|nr:DEAD/DEAH box helicase [Rugamonas brunnea]MBA5637396.1 DEAD/DEAH box helicase [Rugamonas brunnea]
MSNLPVSVKFLDSAASSAAKARGVEPIWPTEDPLDVATALKCINAFQVRVNIEALEALDDESSAQPLVAAARILQSTAQHLRSGDVPSDSADLDELSFHAALAFAMHGNFPSARAALSDVSHDFIGESLVFRMVAAICNPCDRSVRFSSDDGKFEPFRLQWYRALRSRRGQLRDEAFDSALKLFNKAAMAGTMAEGALLLGGRMAAYQAKRLATANLLDDAPEIPNWFVLNSIKAGTVTLLPPQHVLLSKRRIANHGRNTLLTLPTSTGKTFVAEACIASGLSDEGLCVYVAPYVAVGEQVKDSLLKRFKGKVPVVSMFGGFQSEALNVFAEREVVVATPERFDGWLRAGKDIERLRTVVFDEIHILENGVRGARVEGLVSRLRLLQRRNPSLRIIGLSAVLTEPKLVCKWLGVQDDDLHQIGWRPTARRLAMCLANGDMYWIHGNDALRPINERAISAMSESVRIDLPGDIKRAQFPKVNEKNAAKNVSSIARDLLVRLGSPGLVVCPRKLDTRLLARELMGDRERVESAIVLQTADSILERYPYLDFLADCLRRGVAYHNASLPFDVRRDIEQLTRERALSVVCATTTLAEGADLPFRWTIVAHWLSSMYGDGTRMKSMTFRNIAGRCGRAGAFSEGDTVLFENLMGPPSMQRQRSDATRLEEVMFSSSPLMSTLGGEWTTTSAHAQKLLEATFSAQFLACIGEHFDAEDIVSELAGASYAGKTDGADNVRRILSETVISILDDKQAGGAMAVMNSPIRLTEFGQAANLSGFSPATCRLMVQFLLENTFKSDEALYSELLKRFNNVSEQSDETLRKIFSGLAHKNVLKADNLEEMLRNLLLGMDLRTVFESLRSKTSRAQPDTVETWFEDFVSFINGVVGNFLPWILRGLAKLSEYGSEEARATNWSEMAKKVETLLSAKSGGTAVDDSLAPVK